jgi:hypothetical protein
MIPWKEWSTSRSAPKITREFLDQKELTWQVVRETVKKFLSIQVGVIARAAAA